MWRGLSVSVVLTSFRERHSIREVIDNFLATGLVDEVIVVDNNAETGSREEVKKTRAKLLFETKQGQGYALQTGMRAAEGEYIILCEGDGTFNPFDVEKFLLYGLEFPIVLGTRTNTSLIGPDSAMFFLRRIADILWAKLIEVLFRSNRITDIGCTYKLLHRGMVQYLLPHWITGDSRFITEMTLQIVARKLPFVEIPVAFRKRVGISAVTDGFRNVAKWGIKLLWFIVWFRLRWRNKNNLK